MDPRIHIKLNSDFRRVYARGKSAVSPTVVVYCRRNRLDHNRFGFTVSKKLGKAVVRNRVRRRFREIVRLNGEELQTGYDLILVARGRALNAKYRKLEADYLACCTQLRLMKAGVST
ncbi:MAG: ribonuclease P protein component [Oscillospiraceae bacterium]|nr:ribonuclease P protein component [Oscillospiraceae bacterium]